jgi:N-acetylglucosamine-6-phosphate deacetylase
LPRHPNYIWDQLAEDRLYASFIADGFHLPDAVLKVFMAVKGEKAILVSDSMEYSGMPPGVYDSKATGRVRLTPEGKLHREGDPGTLAGSASLLIDGVRRIARLKDLATAWNMASLHPLAILREVRGGEVIHGDRSVSQSGGDGVQAGGYTTPPEKRINPKISGGHAESISTQGLRQGMPADLVLLDTSGSEINLLKVYKNGVEQLPL